MNPAPNVMSDPPRAPEAQARPRWSTPGLSDGLGDRVLMFDQTSATLLEVLRFKREFGDSPAFETALRERVERLRHLHHPSLASVRGIENLAGGEGLALVSKQTAGRRLTDLLPEARGPVFAMESIRQLTPALARLQQSGEGFVHGLLTTDRVVVTREGRLVMVEHVVGSALQAMRLPAARLRAEIGISAPGAATLALDARTDVIQLGLVALSLLLGRRIDPAEYPQGIAARLDEFSRSEAGGTPDSARLRKWLERALQQDPHPFQTAQEAHEGFSDSPADPAGAPSDAVRPVLAFHSPGDTGGGSLDPMAHVPQPMDPVSGASFVHTSATNFSTAMPPALPVMPASALAPDAGVRPQAAAPVVPVAGVVSQPRATAPRITAARWVVIGLSVVAAAEAVVIAGLVYAKPTTIVVEARSPRPDLLALPAVAAAGLDLRDGGAASAPEAPSAPRQVEAPPPPTARPKADAPAERAAPGERFGGIRVAAPIDLQVFEGGKLLGSTAGPIALSEGTHSIDVVNDALSYSSHETVEVKAGQMSGLTITLPSARVSINALPWADVLIDGNPAGQTPLANLSLPIGRHEVTFRHPQLGEQRQTVMVKAGVLTRVSVSLQK